MMVRESKVCNLPEKMQQPPGTLIGYTFSSVQWGFADQRVNIWDIWRQELTTGEVQKKVMITKAYDLGCEGKHVCVPWGLELHLNHNHLETCLNK